MPTGAAECQRSAAAVEREGIGGGRRFSTILQLRKNKKYCGEIIKKFSTVLNTSSVISFGEDEEAAPPKMSYFPTSGQREWKCLEPIGENILKKKI